MGEIGFEEKGLNQQDEPEEYRNASYDYWTLRDVIRDESLTMEERGEAVSEMERLAESGDMYAQYLMGKLWRDGPLLIPNSANAQYWFERAAEQGIWWPSTLLPNCTSRMIWKCGIPARG